MVTNITRFEVLDETGEAYSRTSVRVRLEYLDDGRLLRVHVTEIAPQDLPQVRRNPIADATAFARRYGGQVA